MVQATVEEREASRGGTWRLEKPGQCALMIKVTG